MKENWREKIDERDKCMQRRQWKREIDIVREKEKEEVQAMHCGVDDEVVDLLLKLYTF